MTQAKRPAASTVTNAYMMVLGAVSFAVLLVATACAFGAGIWVGYTRGHSDATVQCPPPVAAARSISEF